MAVKIRLRRMGSKKRPFYRLVVADSRRARDGRFIEMLGYYDPLKEPADIKLDDDKVYNWLDKGAKPSENAAALLRKAGLLEKWQLLKEGVKLTELEGVIEERRVKQPQAKPRAQKEKELKEKAEAQKDEEAKEPEEASETGQAGEKEEEKAQKPEVEKEAEEKSPAEKDEKPEEKPAEEQEQEKAAEENLEEKSEDKEKSDDSKESAKTENDKDKKE